MAGQLAVKLLLEANGVGDAERYCQLLSGHGVETIKQFADLTWVRLRQWGINDVGVRSTALDHAKRLMTSPRDVGTVKQQLLVRACMH